MINELNALDEACAWFQDRWMTTDWSIIPGGVAPVIVWEGRETSAPPPTDQPYVRFNMTPVGAEQASLAGEDGARTWYNEGIIGVQAFAPLQWQNAYEVANYAAIMAKRVYQGQRTPNDMWFRNCRTNRIGPSGGWYQFNTIIEYQYDELR